MSGTSSSMSHTALLCSLKYAHECTRHFSGSFVSFLYGDVLYTHTHTIHTHTHTHHRNVMLLAVEEWCHTHQTTMMKSSMTMATTTAQSWTQATTFVSITRNVTDVPSATVGRGYCELRKVVELNHGWSHLSFELILQ